MRFTSALLVITLAVHHLDTASAATVRGGVRRLDANNQKLTRNDSNLQRNLKHKKKGKDEEDVTTGNALVADTTTAVEADTSKSKKKCKSCPYNMASVEQGDAVNVVDAANNAGAVGTATAVVVPTAPPPTYLQDRVRPPTAAPVSDPPTSAPVTPDPTAGPTLAPVTPEPTTAQPTPGPTESPTESPTASPTAGPTASPTAPPTTAEPTAGPTESPTASPTASPTTPKPSPSPTTAEPTASPTAGPTAGPTESPTAGPTSSPTPLPTPFPTSSPTMQCAGTNVSLPFELPLASVFQAHVSHTTIPFSSHNTSLDNISICRFAPRLAVRRIRTGPRFAARD